MTIHSDWVKILKRANGDCFSRQCPSPPHVVFIDGQIKLMCGAHVRTWVHFFHAQFVDTIESGFATGAEVVVLGFDDYAFVPSAKNMTQQKRVRTVPAAFGEHQELPPAVPEDWTNHIMNRCFKVKVIAFVLCNLRRHYARETERTVVIDWTGPPEVLGKPIALPAVLTTEPDALKRGECDIKGFAWLALGPTLLVSTDGDFVPLALAQIEEQGISHPVYIHRMLCRTEAPKKRSADGRTKREFEYLDMQRLSAFVRSEFAGTPRPARVFASLVALTGCDFCMTLPGAGPTKIWQQRRLANTLDVTAFPGLLAFVTHVYVGLFRAHVNTVGLCIDARDASESSTRQKYEQLSASVKSNGAINERTKVAFWRNVRMEAHVRNALWTLAYWTELHHFPDPLAADYGYERRKKIVAFVGCD
jgi:hypothetical protein